MLRYELFGRVILFEDAAERSYDLQAAAERACLEASHRFSKWYTQRGSIQAVLDGYLPFTRSTIEELAFHPLFSQLAGCEIYDVSEDTYWDRCVSLEGARAALEVVEHQYDAILDRQNAEKAQRTDRKANRSHYRSYTSFHSDAWLQDQAAAGVKNLASFTGHTLWNTVGNAGSAISASIDKNALYKDTALYALGTRRSPNTFLSISQPAGARPMRPRSASLSICLMLWRRSLPKNMTRRPSPLRRRRRPLVKNLWRLCASTRRRKS